MADGFDLHIDAPHAEHLIAAAKALGMDPVDYTRALLEDAIERDNPGYIVRTRMAEYDRTGKFGTLEEVLERLDQRIEERVAREK